MHWSTDDLQYAGVKKVGGFLTRPRKIGIRAGTVEMDEWCDRRERETKYGSDSPK